jgi:hypothetical protein
MDYETALETCSEEVRTAIKWLETQLLKEFLDASKSEEFWLDDNGPEGFDDYFFYDPGLLWYLSKIGLRENEFFKRVLEVFIKKLQTREGRIPTGGEDRGHNRSLRVLISVEPHSEATELAVRNFLNDLGKFLEELKSTDYFHIRSSLFKDLAIGVLALCEFDYLKFKETIGDLGNFLKSEQKEEGYWNEIIELRDGTALLPTEETSIIIEALSRVFGPSDESVIRAVEWLKKHRKEDGSWENIHNTAYACLALISAGEGPKASLEEIEWNEMLTKQKLELTKPKFVQTSPNLDVKIITHPIKGKMKQKYEGEGEKFVVPAFDALQRLLGKGFKPEPLLHARLYIIDNEVLISSADITSEQLEKEFNAGIWTRDEETVEEAIKFFDNLWNASNDKIRLTEEKGC